MHCRTGSRENESKILKGKMPISKLNMIKQLITMSTTITEIGVGIFHIRQGDMIFLFLR